VRIHLVRHAKAFKRARWGGPPELRPLSGVGRRQAADLVEQLEEARIERIVSSPHVRCRKTVEPLAAARELPLELDQRLAEGEPVAKALDLVLGLGNRPTLLCSHGDLIPALLGELEARGLRLEDPLRCEKGSTWVIEGAEPSRARARYQPPSRKQGRGDEDDDEDATTRFGVLDLGSTSFHLLVADASANGEIERVARERVMLRLGAAMGGGSRIPEEVAEKAVESARGLARLAEREGAETLLPVATAALREAANGSRLAARIAEAVCAPVRLLSGEEEARLIFAVFQQRELLQPGPNLGLDLGGGSLELALGDAGGVTWEATLRLGAALLHRECVRSDPMGDEAAEAVRDRTRALLRPHASRIARRRPGTCVAAGGSVRALARLAARADDPPRDQPSDGERLGRRELGRLCKALVLADHDERLRMPGMQKERADLLPTAALVLETLVEELELDGITVSEWGLREGVILEALGLARADRKSGSARS
jgi:exopolyphosphatase/guanosine-5'-triphosphate,3'-diphosphate pyrophosphatase